MERLHASFFAQRRHWRISLLAAANFDELLAHVLSLKDAVLDPPTRVLVEQVLAGKRVATRHGSRALGAPLAREVTGFAMPAVALPGLPQPVQGWEFGALDLVQMRADASHKASGIPALLHGPAEPTSRKRPSVSRRRATNSIGSVESHPAAPQLRAAPPAMEMVPREAHQGGLAERASSSSRASDARVSASPAEDPEQLEVPVREGDGLLEINRVPVRRVSGSNVPLAL